MRDSAAARPTAIQHVDELDQKQAEQDGDIAELAVLSPAAHQQPALVGALVTYHAHSSPRRISSPRRLHRPHPPAHCHMPLRNLMQQHAQLQHTLLRARCPLIMSRPSTHSTTRQCHHSSMTRTVIATAHRVRQTTQTHSSLRQRLHRSAVSREISQLRPLVVSSVRSPRPLWSRSVAPAASRCCRTYVPPLPHYEPLL